jgi:hypothetical protein
VLTSGDLKFKTIKLSNMKVYTYGDAGIVTGTATQDGTFKGDPVEPQYCVHRHVCLAKRDVEGGSVPSDYRSKMRSLAGLCTFTKSSPRKDDRGADLISDVPSPPMKGK